MIFYVFFYHLFLDIIVWTFFSLLDLLIIEPIDYVPIKRTVDASPSSTTGHGHNNEDIWLEIILSAKK
jgi:hypothetical protein